MTDQVVAIIVVTGLAVSVGLIIFFAIKLQTALADKEIDEITLKDASIAKEVDDTPLSQLIDDNNKGNSTK